MKNTPSVVTALIARLAGGVISHVAEPTAIFAQAPKASATEPSLDGVRGYMRIVLRDADGNIIWSAGGALRPLSTSPE